MIDFLFFQKIVKCTTCKQGMREVVLTKCMHSGSLFDSLDAHWAHGSC